VQPRSFTQTVQCAIAVIRNQVALLSAAQSGGAARPGASPSATSEPAAAAGGDAASDAGKPGPAAVAPSAAGAGVRGADLPAGSGGGGQQAAGAEGDDGAAGVRLGEVMHGAAGLGTLVLDREMRTLRCRCAPPAAPRWQGGRGQTRPMGTGDSPFVACPLSSFVPFFARPRSSLVPFLRSSPFFARPLSSLVSFLRSPPFFARHRSSPASHSSD
jgi:hypothetical protein